MGSEGTLGVITGARLRVRPAPRSELRTAYRFQSFSEGVEACRRVLWRGATPAVLRLYDDAESRQSFDQPGALLLVLDEGDGAVVETTMETVAEECGAFAGEALGSGPVDAWMGHRDDVYDLDDLTRQGLVGDTMEVAARWSSLPTMHDDVTASLRSVDGTVWASAHLSHAYSDGACLYFSFAGRSDGWYVAAWDAAAGAVLSHGAALSHHHGIGVSKARFLPAALGPAHGVLADLKRALDPAGVLNPGKLGLPDRFGTPTWPRP